MRRRLILAVSVLWLFVGGAGVASVASADDQLPDFMEHWEFGWNIDEDAGPSYFADTIFPLYRSPEEQGIVFLEPRFAYADSEWLLNLGGGYRQPIRDGRWLMGGNMFYDYDSDHSHYRLGWGLEALSSFAEARANYYLGLSDRRRIDETDTISTFEKAMDGYDLELGMPVPYYSRVKVFSGFNWYNSEKFDDNRYGWTLRTEYKPTSYLVLDGLVSNDTKSNVDWGLTLAFKIPLGANDPTEIRSPLELDEAMFPASDVTDQLWRLVERHHEIVLEKYQEVGGVAVEVLRGT